MHPELVKKTLSTTLPLTLLPFKVTIAENDSGPIPAETAVNSAKRQRVDENQPQSSAVEKPASTQSSVDDETTIYEEDLDLVQV